MGPYNIKQLGKSAKNNNKIIKQNYRDYIVKHMYPIKAWLKKTLIIDNNMGPNKIVWNGKKAKKE